MLDDKFVYVNIVCFYVSCLQLEYGTFVPRVHLRKCTLKTPLLLLLLSLSLFVLIIITRTRS